jgi:hypothetical protein
VQARFTALVARQPMVIPTAEQISQAKEFTGADNCTDDIKRVRRRYDEGASQEDVRSSRDKFRKQTFFVISGTVIA